MREIVTWVSRWGVVCRRLSVAVSLLATGCLLMASAAAASGTPCGSSGVLSWSPTTATCTYSTGGTEDAFTVPAGVTTLDVSAVGAAGDPGGGAAGSGAVVENAALPVPTGVTELWVDVAGGSWPDGGSAGGDGFTGAGGGSSAVSTAPRASATLTGDPSTDSRLLVAGGGGGAASESEAGGGSAGDTTVTGAGNGGCYSIYTPGNGGVGPTNGAGGGGQAPDGCDGGHATSGTAAVGGNGDTMTNAWGGGGGGGWFGGGGSTLYAAGGGGSSYGGAGSGTVTIATAANTSVAPEVTISYALATPSIETSQQPSSVIRGGQIADEASVTGGANPTGTVTFELFSNGSCSGTALLIDTENLSAGAATATSYTTTAAGTFYWEATYSGDQNNSEVSSPCSGEPVVVSLLSPTIDTTQQPASATVGSSVADMATLSGGQSPSGTVAFSLFSNDSCSGIPVFTDTESLSGESATSTGYATTTPGAFYWVAAYNGDANNSAVISPCSEEPVIVTATAAVVPQPPPFAPPFAPPDAPTGVTATGGNGLTTVSWARPSYNGGTAISRYTVTAEPGGQTCTTTTNSCVILGLANGTRYTVDVTATNAAGTGPAAYTASVMRGAFSLVWHRQRASGTIYVELKLPGPGTVGLLGTHSDLATAALDPGYARFAYGRRSDVTITKGGRVHLALRPNAAGERLLHRHAADGMPLHVRLWISYTPSGGATTLLSCTARVLAAHQ